MKPARRLEPLSFIARLGVLFSALAFSANGFAGQIPLYDPNDSLDSPQPHGPGAPLVSRLPHNSGGLTSDSMGFEEPGAPIYFQYIADDFSLSQDAVLRKLVYWGFYNSQHLPTGDETFQINVHAPRPSDGLPGEIVFAETVVNPFREWTGRNVLSAAGGREYRFVVDLATPFFLAAGELHWLSIYQVGDPASSFRWEFSQNPGPANGQVFKNVVYPNWELSAPITSNTAYELYSIPETTTSGLVLMGVILSCVLRRRRAFR